MRSARERGKAASLLELFGALATASTPDEVAVAMVEHGPPVFGAVGVVLTRLVDPGSHLEIMHVGDMPDRLREQWRTIPIDAPVPLADAARLREPVFLSSREEWRQRYPHLTPVVEATRHHANAVTPLMVDERLLGVLGLAFEEPREFNEEERTLVLTLASQCALVLDRARLYESELVARNDAELANRAKSDFLAAMSHELRTPLHAIAGYADLIAVGALGPVTEEQVKSLERIQLSQRHLLGLINTVLEFSRTEAGAVEYELTEIPLDEMLVNCVALAAPQAREKNVDLRFTGSEPGLMVHADRPKTRQVVINLLANAVKFTGSGGSVSVDAARNGERHVVIRVVDTGCGIPPDKFASIFEPFVQVNGNGVHEGTGLGLAISRRLARGMGGDITVESTLGQGSTFSFTLPIGDATMS